MNNNRHIFKKQKLTKITKTHNKITYTLPTIKMKTKNTIL